MDLDVVIIGGGLVGASLATALKSSGLSIGLLESQPASASNDGWTAASTRSVPAMQHFLRLWRMATFGHGRVQAVHAMRVFGDEGAELDFSAYEIGAPELNFIVENRLLQQALWQELQQQDNLTLFHPARCASPCLA